MDKVKKAKAFPGVGARQMLASEPMPNSGCCWPSLDFYKFKILKEVLELKADLRPNCRANLLKLLCLESEVSS